MDEKQLKNMDTWFNDRFDKRFNEKIKQGGYIKSWLAIVDTYDSGTELASVHLPNDTINIIPDIKNKSGVSLSATDVVELHSRLSTLGSCYIQVKY
jgi:hypothetical protein